MHIMVMRMATEDDIYQRCVLLAQTSPCQKRGFGCVLVKDDEIISQSNNHDIDNISNLCKPVCIRLSMPSGSDSMIGDCGHAEEHTIWECIRKLGTAKGAELWVLGIDRSTGKILENLKFYCTRCSTLMRYAGILGVHIWYDDKWNFVATAEAYQTSLEYSLKK